MDFDPRQQESQQLISLKSLSHRERIGEGIMRLRYFMLDNFVLDLPLIFSAFSASSV